MSILVKNQHTLPKGNYLFCKTEFFRFFSVKNKYQFRRPLIVKISSDSYESSAIINTEEAMENDRNYENNGLTFDFLFHDFYSDYFVVGQ